MTHVPDKAGGLSAARRQELEEQFRLGNKYIAHQRRLIDELEAAGRSTMGVTTVLWVLEQEQQAIVDELGYSPS